MQGQGSGAVRPPIGIAFDGDLGNRIDAMLAVAMLNGFTAKTEARRISLSVSRAEPAIRAARRRGGQLLPRPARRPALAAGVGAISEGMIGMPDGPAPDKDTPPLAATLSKKGADGTPLYTSAITGLLDTAESAVLIRNLLLAQHDGNATIVLAGPADRSGPAARPVSVRPADRGEVQAAGRGRRIVPRRAARPDDQERRGRGQEAVRRVADADRRRRIRSRRRAAVSRREHRQGLRVGARAPGRRRVPRRSSRCPTTRPRPRWRPCSTPCTPMTATSSCPTRARSRVLDDGRTRFTPAAEGKHRYLIVDPAQKERVVGVYTAMVSAQPAPRPGRRAWGS